MGGIGALGFPRRALIGLIALGALALAACVGPTTPPTPAAPKAAFTSSAAPLTVSFTDQSTGAITGWSWDFGDSATSTEQNPTHIYATHGDYTVALTVTGPGGNDTSSSTITVNPPAPVASFTAEPPSGTSPITVMFTDTSTGVITDRLWDLNADGIFDDATGPSATHTFDTAGEHVVGLKVAGPGGESTTSKTIAVALPPPPVASFNAAPTTGEAPVTVNFADTSTGVIDGQSWDFESDGSIDATGPSASHTYTAAGDYPVTLIVTGPGGTASSTQTIQVTVNTPPTVGITTPESGASFTAGSAVMFAGTVSDLEDGQLQPVLDWSSDINGTLGSGNAISVNTLTVGTHTITAAATDSGGKTGTANITVILVNEVPSSTTTTTTVPLPPPLPPIDPNPCGGVRCEPRDPGGLPSRM